MRRENTRKSLEEQIIVCKKKLKELSPEIETDETKSKEYNKIIVQKAILVDRYKKLCYRPSLLTLVKNALKPKKKEKLICDYFLS